MFVGNAEDKSLLAGKWLLRNIDHACFSRDTTPEMNVLATDGHDPVAVLDDPELTRTTSSMAITLPRSLLGLLGGAREPSGQRQPLMPVGFADCPRDWSG